MDLDLFLSSEACLKELDTRNPSVRYSGTTFLLFYPHVVCSLDLPASLDLVDVLERIDWSAHRTYMRVTLARNSLRSSKHAFDARGHAPRIWTIDMRRSPSTRSTVVPRIDAFIGQLPRRSMLRLHARAAPGALGQVPKHPSARVQQHRQRLLCHLNMFRRQSELCRGMLDQSHWSLCPFLPVSVRTACSFL